jgi:NAD+ kinase
MKAIGIVARPDLVEARAALEGLVGWLRQRGVEVVIEEKSAAILPDPRKAGARVVAGPEVAAAVDALVVLGGDGTFLSASSLLESKAIPVLGVNFGSLGFLTEVTLPELFPTLEGLLSGEFRSEERRMLRGVVERNGTQVLAGDVLNDLVITKAAQSRIIDLEVSIDGLFVSAFRADGLIVATPTGSTAYNLAAGGPILHPALPAAVLTPICPHMLANRPLVIADQAAIEIRLLSGRNLDVMAAFDGQRVCDLVPGDRVSVTRSQRTLSLVKAPGRDYFGVLRTKLKWGESTRRT